MPWSHLLGFAAALPLPDAGPADSTSSSIATYILGYGPLGAAVLAMCWLFYKRWRFISPSQEAAIRKEAREEGRSDLLAQIDRILGEKKTAEDQRDEAMRFARDQLAPLLSSFTSSTSSLLPLLQDLVSRRERGRLGIERTGLHGAGRAAAGGRGGVPVHGPDTATGRPRHPPRRHPGHVT